MKKKRILIILFAMILAFAIAGCNGKNKVDKKDTEVSGDVSENESVLENETVTENKVTEETQKTDNKKDNTTINTETNKNNTTSNKNESTSNKNETTTKPSTGNADSNKKPSTGSTTKPSTGSTGSTNNSGNTGNTQNNNGGTTTQPSTPVHEHKWTEVVEEEIHYYAWRTICNVCNADITDLGSEGIINHTFECGGASYANYYKEVDFVTENVVKTPVVTGYKCECGAEK